MMTEEALWDTLDDYSHAKGDQDLIAEFTLWLESRMGGKWVIDKKWNLDKEKRA